MSRRRRRRRPRFGGRRVGATAAPCPTPFRLHFHLDVNRDGVVDDDYLQNDLWQAGKDKPGAIMLVNCDDEDDKTPDTDNSNEVIDTSADDGDIAPLYIRKHPATCPPPRGWKAFVEVSDFHKDCIRIFKKDKFPGSEILGPTRGNRFQVEDLGKSEWKYGMEATQYPGRMKRASGVRGVGPRPDRWDGMVNLKLTIVDGAGVEKYSETAKVRAAPWLIFTHMDPTERLYVCKTGDNADFVAAVRGASGHSDWVEWDSEDRWMQDVMEIGFSTLPKRPAAPEQHLTAAVRTANRRRASLEALFPDEILKPNYGFYKCLNEAGFMSMDSFGNLECVPPFTHPTTRKDYKFGRIIYGLSAGSRHTDMREEVREFLADQKVQFPFTVNTGWLQVGHIDEVCSFLPCNSAPKKFKVVLASPKLALDILRGLPPATPMFQGIDLTVGLSPDWQVLPPKLTVRDVLDETTDPNIVEASNYSQDMIDEIREVLIDEVGLGPDEFIDIPILFVQDDTSLQCIAYTAGSVNMLVVTSGPTTLAGDRSTKLCVPKPFGPLTGAVGTPCEFEKRTRALLEAAGAGVTFVEDFTTYHNGSGEIHCGSNSKRKGATDRFWWEQQDI